MTGGGPGRLAVVLGDPVEHSLSPRLHNAGFEALGLLHRYEKRRVTADRFADVVAELREQDALGANVTVPHKLRAAALCEVLTEEARLIGAVNTLWWVDGVLHGTNTDATGFGRDLDLAVRDAGVDLARGAVLLGTGGAARAVGVALGRRSVDVTVVGRRADAVTDIVTLVQRAGGAATGFLLAEAERLAGAVAAAGVVLNATSLGMHGERLPDPFHRLANDQLAYDCVYGASTPPFVADARARGVAAHDGRGMLAAQAEDAFEVWTGLRPPVNMFRELLTT